MEEMTGVAPSGGRRFVVDRFEGDLVVVALEDGRILDLPRGFVPAGAREGDVLVAAQLALTEGRVTVEVAIDRTESDAARRAVREQLARLRGAAPPARGEA